MKYSDSLTIEEVNLKKKALYIINDSYENNTDRKLRTVYLFLTRKCNLSCTHCYINGVGPKASDFDFNLDKIKDIIFQAKEMGLKKVKVSGGEPFVHKEIMEILSFLNELGLEEIVLETNGLLVQDKDIEKLNSIKRLTIFVSLDHIDANQHDSFRNKAGAYKKTFSFLEKLGKSQVNSVVTTTAFKNNIDCIEEIIDRVIGIGIKRHRTLLNIHPIGNALQNLENGLTLEECIYVIGKVLNSKFYADGKAYLTLPPALTPVDSLRNIHTCGWGDKVLGVLSTGDISMCSASYEDANMIAGNINDAPLVEIWNGPFFNELREIANGKVKGVCGNCIFFKTCKGVCKMSSYAHYGDKDAPYPLCQEFYNAGLFPNYALIEPSKDCTYQPNRIPFSRKSNTFQNTFKALSGLMETSNTSVTNEKTKY